MEERAVPYYLLRPEVDLIYSPEPLNTVMSKIKMSAQIPPEEVRFSQNTTIMANAVLEAIEKLHSQGYKTVEPMLVRLASVVMAGFDKHYLIQGFIENSHFECWDKIKVRDEEYFKEHVSEVFQYLPMDKVNLFKDLFDQKDANGKSVVPDSLKNQIWELFDSMIKISIKYVHKQREPYSYGTETGVVSEYKMDFLEAVDVPRHSQTWGVKLDFPAQC